MISALMRAWIMAVCGAALVLPLAAQADGDAPRVSIVTSEGTIVVELDPEHAPKTVDNFLKYVKKGQYNGTIFHRVISTFMIQGGGHLPDMKEKPTGKPIVSEATNGLSNDRGTIAMAREEAPDSATAQFYINVVDNPFLNHVDIPPEGATINRRGKEVFIAGNESAKVYGYTVFGHVIEGMDVVDRIRDTPTTTVGEFENVPQKTIVIQKVTILK